MAALPQIQSWSAIEQFQKASDGTKDDSITIDIPTGG